MLQRLEQKLLRRKKLGSLRTIDLAPAPLAGNSHTHQERVDFSSNDYLGLARSRPLFSRIEEDYARYVRASAPCEPVLGATGSRLLTGNNRLHHETECIIADFHKQPVALLANSGWDLNFGMLTSVVDTDTFVIYDELSHNSLLMGIRAGKAGSTAFRHNDMEALRRQLEASRDRPEKLVVVEAVYSMDGDIAPIQTVLDLAAEFGAHVLVDEAHSTGMLGARGEGLVVSQGLQGHSALLGCVHTFGKALGQHGAVLVTPHASLKQFLVNYCSPLIYSTAMPISSLVAVQASYAFCADSSAERQNLQSLIAHFRKQAVQLDLPTLESNTAIQGVLVPGNAAVLEASKQLQSLGLGCLPIRAPTVAAGTERIRVVLHAHNTEQQVDLLCSSIARILQNNA